MKIPRNDRGVGALVSIVVSLLVVFALIALYLRSFRRSTQAAPPKQTLQGMQERAKGIEQREQERYREMQAAGGAPGD